MPKRVLLINPPSPFLISQTSFPPLSLLYLAAALEEWGHDVRVMDLGLTTRLHNHFAPDVIGITALTPHLPWLKKFMPIIRMLHPQAKVIVGGAHFSNMPNDAWGVGADEVCVGDGEAGILNAVMLPHTTVRGGVVDIGEWPKPARHLLPLRDYSYKIGGEWATPILTSRGCPYSCAYCSRGRGAFPQRHQSLKKVDQELENIRELGFGAVMDYSDEINISTKHLLELCRVYGNSGLFWRAFVRSNLFTIEQATAMRESGCVEVCCGVESGSDTILQTVNKRATVADATNFVQICREADLKCKVFLIVGLPGETEATAMETMEWLLKVRPDNFDICPFTPYPGSHIFHHPELYDIQIHENYWNTAYVQKGKPGEYQVVVSTSALSRERIAELREWIEEEGRRELGLEPLEEAVNE